MHILLADDHTLIRENLEEFLHRLGPDVTVIQAATLDEALDATAGQRKFDLILLDLMMPGMNGLMGLHKMRDRLPDVPVVMLSGTTNQEYIKGALKAGAKGFIPKSISGKAMLNAVRLVLSGETFVPFLALDGGEDPAADSAAQPSFPADSPLAALSRREREVLGYLLRGYPNKKIANQLKLQEVTIKAHLRNVFQKFGVSNRTEAAATAYRLGLGADSDIL